MKKLSAVIETSENKYSAYIKELDGVVATGETIDEIKKNLLEAVDVFMETCNETGYEIPDVSKGDYEIEFKMDVKSFLNIYSSVLSKSAIERLTGINQKQLWHYANGKSEPRQLQKQRIENAIHKLGQDFMSIRL